MFHAPLLSTVIASILIVVGCGGTESENAPASFSASIDALTVDDYWRPTQDCSAVNTANITNDLKAFPDWHPNYDHFPVTLNNAKKTLAYKMVIPVEVRIDTRYWSESAVKNHLTYVNRYYRAANIYFQYSYSTTFDFTSSRILSRYFPNGTSGKIHLIFSDNITAPSGAQSDAWGSLPLGTAVINKQIMTRSWSNDLPYFNPVKPIGHQLGRVLGLADYGSYGSEFLMSLGTEKTNGLTLLLRQMVIQRFMATYRFNGSFIPM